MSSKNDVVYKEAYIYKIEGNGCTYYGSTITSLEERLSKHVSAYFLYLKNEYRFTTSFKCFENECKNYEIKLIETLYNISRFELHDREKYYIRNFECTNKHIPNRSNREYRMDNKDKLNKYHLCDCCKYYRFDNKSHHMKTKYHINTMQIINQVHDILKKYNK